VRSRSGDVVAALNIGTQAGRIGLGVMQTQLLPRLREAAQRLGTLLN
jgi:IclR family pca regulon transcriptional regulator